MLDEFTSLRLALLRFPLIVGVVFIHAWGTTVSLGNGEIGVRQADFVVNFIMNFISDGIARVSVPLFFLMSGYLFFLNFAWSGKAYFEKFKKKTKTLLVPYLFWNLATLLAVAFAQSMPATRAYFSGKNLMIASYHWSDFINAVFGVNRFPIAYQFWFVRDLMVLVLLVPVLNFINSFMRGPFLLILFLTWFFDLWPFYVPASEAVLFFCFGAYLATAKKNIFYLDKYGRAIGDVYFFMVILDTCFYRWVFSPYLHKIGVAFGVLTALFFSKRLAESNRVRSWLLWLSGTSFFVYASHEPLLTIVKKFLYKTIIPSSSIAFLALYFFSPIFVVVFSLLVYRLLLRLAPKFVSAVTGGR